MFRQAQDIVQSNLTGTLSTGTMCRFKLLFASMFIANRLYRVAKGKLDSKVVGCSLCSAEFKACGFNFTVDLFIAE